MKLSRAIFSRVIGSGPTWSHHPTISAAAASSPLSRFSAERPAAETNRFGLRRLGSRGEYSRSLNSGPTDLHAGCKGHKSQRKVPEGRANPPAKPPESRQLGGRCRLDTRRALPKPAFPAAGSPSCRTGCCEPGWGQGWLTPNLQSPSPQPLVALLWAVSWGREGLVSLEQKAELLARKSQAGLVSASPFCVTWGNGSLSLGLTICQRLSARALQSSKG